MNEIIKLSNALLNITDAPVFVYEVSKEAILPIVEEYDRIVRLRDQFIISGNKLTLSNIEPNLFLSNILMLDSSMHKILSEMILLSMREGVVALNDLAMKLEKNNPLGFDQSSSHSYYTYKIKLFLIALASGMKTNEVWLGTVKSGIVKYEVSNQGKIMSFTVAQLQLLGDYLIKHSFLFCEVIEESEKYLKIKMIVNMKTCLEDKKPVKYDEQYDEELGIADDKIDE